MTRIGFIGLGVMGAPMAGHLLAGGHQLAIYTRRTPPPDLVAAGAEVLPSSTAVAEASEVIITVLPDTPDVADVLFGPAGVVDGLTSGKVVIDMSSIAPGATRQFAARIAELGCGYLDAPVSGGQVGAKAASLTIMVGGEADLFERMRPLFELMGKNITRIGPVGAGQTCKVANQMIVAGTIEIVAEALLFASRAGADPAVVRTALMGGFAASRILEVHGERMLARTFDPGFRIELHGKDLALALDGAREMHLSLPVTAICQQLLNATTALGHGGADHSAMVRSLESLAAHALDDGPA